MSGQQKADSDLQASTNHPGVSLGRGVGARYLTQKWGGGTECDRTGVSREIEIQVSDLDPPFIFL